MARCGFGVMGVELQWLRDGSFKNRIIFELTALNVLQYRC